MHDDEDAALLHDIERYYDEVPRAAARAEDLGPFTLFVRRDPRGWPFYARPRLGHQGGFTTDDVRRVRERQRALDAPESFEWVHQISPALTEVVRRADLELAEHPLMVLAEPGHATPPDGVTVEVLEPEHPRIGEVLAAISAAFAETDETGAPQSTDAVRDRLADGSYRLVGATGPDGRVVGGGSHAPRATVTELTGIAVLPAARTRGIGAAITAELVADARGRGVETVFLSAGSPRVAGIYGRVGFVRVGTACIAEPRDAG